MHVRVRFPQADLRRLTRIHVPNLLVGRAVLASYRSAWRVDVPQPDSWKF